MAFPAMAELIFFNATQYQGHSFNLTVRTSCCSYCICQTEVPIRFLDNKGAQRLTETSNPKNFATRRFSGSITLRPKFWPSSMIKQNRPHIRFFSTNIKNLSIDKKKKFQTSLSYAYRDLRGMWLKVLFGNSAPKPHSRNPQHSVCTLNPRPSGLFLSKSLNSNFLYMTNSFNADNAQIR